MRNVLIISVAEALNISIVIIASNERIKISMAKVLKMSIAEVLKK